MAEPLDIARVIAQRERTDRIFNVLGWAVTIGALAVLLLLVADLGRQGLARIDWSFLTSFPSRRPEQAGILSAWVGSLLLMFVTAALAVPLGIAAGIYLEEYSKRGWLSNIIEINISNLAGVPSIIFGLMALGLFVQVFGFGQSILSGGLALAFLVLPIVIVATREALRSIPTMIREAAYALGATRWQVVQHHLLPYSLGGTATGVIIAMSRAIGETAPLITIGALTFIAFLPPVPFQARPWLNSTASTPITEADRTRPIVELPASTSGARVTPGSFTILGRTTPPEGEPSAPRREEAPVTVVIDRTTTIEEIRTKVDAIPWIKASYEYDALTFEAEDNHEFVLRADSAGVGATLGFASGGGRHGPTEWIWSGFTVLPIQMFNWVSRPGEDFLTNAAAAGIVLLVLTLGLNTVAIIVRYRLRRRIKW